MTINGDRRRSWSTARWSSPARRRLEAVEGRRGDRAPATRPAVYVSGAAASSSATRSCVSRDGFGVFITAGAGNKIVRTGVATGGHGDRRDPGPDRTGRRRTSDVTVESSILTGGGAGIRAFTRNNEAEALAGRRAGDITLTLRHVTAAGSTNGIDLDSSNARTLLGGTGQHHRDGDRLDRASTTGS